MKIVLTGSLAVDQIMNFDGYFKDMIQPDKLHVLSISVLLKKLKRTRGGIAGNIAYSLALLGEHPLLLASIGEDQKTYIEALAKLGVDTTSVHYSKLPTASFSVITDKADCQVGGFYPGAMGDAAALSIRSLSQEDILFVVSAHDPEQMGKQIQEAVQLKKRLFFDIGQQVIILPENVLREGVVAAELMILNDYEMGVLAKRIGKTEAEIIQQVETCVVTLGEKGSKIYTKAKGSVPSLVPAVNVENVIDPTGAGDAFRAGFIYGYVRGWQVEQCAQLAATVAAFALEKFGTQEHHFTKEELSTRYQKAYKTPLTLE